MTSLMTNTAAISALSTLRSISDDMNSTQNRISSGYKVENASDNAAYWSIATTMRSDNKALGAVEDAIGLGSAKTDTAYTGMESAIDVVTDIKAKLVAAREPGVDKEKINKELVELKNQLSSVAKSASFNGENWLYDNSEAEGTIQEMVGSFVRGNDGNVSIKTITFDTTNSILINDEAGDGGLLTKGTVATYAYGTTTTTASYYLISSVAGNTSSASEVTLTSSTTDDEIDGMVSAVDKMLSNMTDAASTIGATTSRLKLQDSFIKDLSDTIDTGVGRLVDADMNEESTKLKALQTQQQLGIQSLSIANSNSENVLSLFK
ncbi:MULTISPECIES: flagellin [Rhizobium/Agrobacterium group]|uniref:flagellin N-terminal helical domain-containing protein n=1 Tax=Rhizobium/Agrobacterium group TaxID=227290 RepID=UPI000B401CF4|nr:MULTISPECIES: flagellin [Rhizobium/Agrobacterium group]MCF1464202.1 flagellin [Allorhizobium ampelinum]MCF1473284.1 flagellin [Allorhizobium ampelinum]MCF1484672.1 flagellin [Allorhizobium ampelinum]MVA53201.1 flagellin [Agrobacterium vitis]MVA61156.1 flagellin [Agrobacterium vitis]